MGGVDKMDWLINKYRTKIRAKKWYFPFFTNMIDMAVVNAHVLYCMANEKNPTAEIQVKYNSCIHENFVGIRRQNSGRPSLNKNTLCVFQKKCEGASPDMHWNAQWREAKGNVLFAKQCSKAMHEMQCWAACKLFSCMASVNV